MRKAKEAIIVHFRKWQDGDVIALFDDGIGWGYCMSYEHVGQHGAASSALIEHLDRAAPEEYAPLKRELESIGYAVTVAEEV